MTNEELQAHISAIKDAIHRGEVQRHEAGEWREVVLSPFNYYLRIKPEPREFWINKGHLEELERPRSGSWRGVSIFNSGNPSEYVRVREVLE